MIALFLLAALILQQSWGLNWFTRSAKAVTYLPDVGGLKPGAPVWLAGIEIGRVRSVTIVRPKHIPETQRFTAALKKRTGKYSSSIKSLRRNPKMTVNYKTTSATLKWIYGWWKCNSKSASNISTGLAGDSEVSIESRGLIGDSFINISPGTLGGRPPQRGEYYVIESLQRPGFSRDHDRSERCGLPTSAWLFRAVQNYHQKDQSGKNRGPT